MLYFSLFKKGKKKTKELSIHMSNKGILLCSHIQSSKFRQVYGIFLLRAHASFLHCYLLPRSFIGSKPRKAIVAHWMPLPILVACGSQTESNCMKTSNLSHWKSLVVYWIKLDYGLRSQWIMTDYLFKVTHTAALGDRLY